MNIPCCIIRIIGSGTAQNACIASVTGTRNASRLLETTQAGVAEIANRVGYDAEAAFSKAFKRWIGVAPGAYRRTAESGRNPSRSSGDGL